MGLPNTPMVIIIAPANTIPLWHIPKLETNPWHGYPVITQGNGKCTINRHFNGKILGNHSYMGDVHSHGCNVWLPLIWVHWPSHSNDRSSRPSTLRWHSPMIKPLEVRFSHIFLDAEARFGDKPMHTSHSILLDRQTNAYPHEPKHRNMETSSPPPSVPQSTRTGTITRG